MLRSICKYCADDGIVGGISFICICDVFISINVEFQNTVRFRLSYKDIDFHMLISDIKFKK